MQIADFVCLDLFANEERVENDLQDWKIAGRNEAVSLAALTVASCDTHLLRFATDGVICCGNTFPCLYLSQIPWLLPGQFFKPRDR